MTDEQKQEFLYLLHLYMHDLLQSDKMNQKKHELPDKYLSYPMSYGVKAQYNHARCIEKRIALEVQDNIKVY